MWAALTPTPSTAAPAEAPPWTPAESIPAGISPQSTWVVARRLAKEGRAAEAEALVRQTLQHRPDDYDLLVLLGTLLLWSGKAPAADECFRAADAIAPGTPDVIEGRVRALAAMERTGEARALLAQAAGHHTPETLDRWTLQWLAGSGARWAAHDAARRYRLRFGPHPDADRVYFDPVGVDTILDLRLERRPFFPYSSFGARVRLIPHQRVRPEFEVERSTWDSVEHRFGGGIFLQPGGGLSVRVGLGGATPGVRVAQFEADAGAGLRFLRRFDVELGWTFRSYATGVRSNLFRLGGSWGPIDLPVLRSYLFVGLIDLPGETRTVVTPGVSVAALIPVHARLGFEVRGSAGTDVLQLAGLDPRLVGTFRLAALAEWRLESRFDIQVEVGIEGWNDRPPWPTLSARHTFHW